MINKILMMLKLETVFRFVQLQEVNNKDENKKSLYE